MSKLGWGVHLTHPEQVVTSQSWRTSPLVALLQVIKTVDPGVPGPDHPLGRAAGGTDRGVLTGS